jgi:hypothetical protein
MARRRHEASGDGVNREIAADRAEPTRIGRREPHVLAARSTELIAMDADHGVVDLRVPVDGDVPDVHVRVPLDDDVVHDVRPAPATPPAPPEEADRPPPWDEWLAEPERHPAD